MMTITNTTINNNSTTNNNANTAATAANAARPLAPRDAEVRPSTPRRLSISTDCWIEKVPLQSRPFHLNRRRACSHPARFRNLEVMPLSDQLRTFANNWRGKTQAYAVDDLGGAFDRFFTSYVVFNRLYAEAAYRLARRGRLNLREPFPDSRGSSSFAGQRR
jgi:hypothetical protein